MSTYIGQNVYIRPTYIVSLPEFYSEHSGMSLAARLNMRNLSDNSHNGVISKKAVKGMRNAINWLLCAAEPKRVFRASSNSWFDFKVNFITLTLPDTSKKVTDYEFKTKLLNPWLTYARKYLGLKNYVWKLEFQKNGKLHLHLTSDTFIHWDKIRSSWNKLLGANSMLIDYINKFQGCTLAQYLELMPSYDKRTKEQKEKAWIKGTKENWTNPNTSDVHSVKKIKNLAAYLVKYMSKSDELLKSIKGRIWGCNYELSRANKIRLHIPATECAAELSPLMSKGIEWKQLLTPDKYSGELRSWGEIFFLTYNDWRTKIKGNIKELFNNTILGLKNLAHDGTLFTDLLTV